MIHQPEIVEIVRKDPRYMSEAYEFMFEALNYTQKMLGRTPGEAERNPGPQHHVSGPELLHGCCAYARSEFGLMARTVFYQWGLHRTSDIGEIIFNLIDAELLCKTETDHRSDFQDVFDLDKALSDDYTITLDEAVWGKRGSQ